MRSGLPRSTSEPTGFSIFTSLSMKTGAGRKWNPFFSPARLVGAAVSAAGGGGGGRPGRTRNRRHHGNADEPDGDRRARGWPGWVCGSRAHLSIAASRGTRWDGRGFAPVAHLSWGPSTRPETVRRLPGRRACWWTACARSPPRVGGPGRPGRPWGRVGGPGGSWCAGSARRRPDAGRRGGLDQRPAQVLGAVLGQRAAVVFAAGLVDPRAQPGVAGQFGRAGEAGDVADLAADVQYGVVQVGTTQPDDSGHAQPASMERSGMPLSAASDPVSRG